VDSPVFVETSVGVSLDGSIVIPVSVADSLVDIVVISPVDVDIVVISPVDVDIVVISPVDVDIPDVPSGTLLVTAGEEAIVDVDKVDASVLVVAGYVIILVGSVYINLLVAVVSEVSLEGLDVCSVVLPTLPAGWLVSSVIGLLLDMVDGSLVTTDVSLSEVVDTIVKEVVGEVGSSVVVTIDDIMVSVDVLAISVEVLVISVEVLVI